MTSEEARRLASALGLLARNPIVPPLPDNLGYRGFEILVKPGELEPWRQLTVYRDVVVARNERETVAFLDPQRTVEIELLETACAHDPALVPLIKHAMSMP
jgi:hypothetical protein